MKRGKTIFLVIYLIFHLVFLVAAIVINLKAEDFEFLFSVRDHMGASVWFAVVGLLLFIINVIVMTASTRHHNKKEEQLRQDINSLKAKIYDLQDAQPSKNVTPASSAKPEASESDEDKTTSSDK